MSRNRCLRKEEAGGEVKRRRGKFSAPLMDSVNSSGCDEFQDAREVKIWGRGRREGPGSLSHLGFFSLPFS